VTFSPRTWTPVRHPLRITMLWVVAGWGCAPSVRQPLRTVALRVHNMDAMLEFYTRAFGFSFESHDTYGLASHFGTLDGLTLKFVPIRDSADFVGFPVHQLGFAVQNVDAVIALATELGGRIEGAPETSGDTLHAAIRDPDGNTIELYGPRPAASP